MNENAVLKFTEGLDNVVGALTSYKAKLITAGFDKAIAEQMCVALNQALIASAFAQMRPKR
jgi:hypothetical protein